VLHQSGVQPKLIQVHYVQTKNQLDFSYLPSLTSI
jgi:hypothetical protein